MGFGSRKPTSNEVSSDRSENPYGPQSEVNDDTAVLLNKKGKRCHGCKRVILNEHVRYRAGDEKPYCPDCV